VELVARRHTPPRPGAFGEWPANLDARIADRLRERGVDRPYRHQAQALEHVREGRDVVLATSTASGKSLCFQLPLLQAVLEDKNSRALLMFPTKALGRDQVEHLRDLAGPGLGMGVGVYDGDTPPDERRATRARAHAVATNPDMLHRGVLPNHELWSSLFAGLRYVVLDELHTYRGVFGSHVANVLRRLWRVCAYYGSRPQVIACSATIANPQELAARLTGRPQFALVDGDTAPTGDKTFVVLNPSVVDPLTGVRRDYLKVTRAVTNEIRQRGLATLAFCRTRKAVELLTRYLREDEAGVSIDRFGATTGPVDADARRRAERKIRGYRGGYLPELRREIEKALREGEAQVVASTNALELGMDIGGLDAVVLAGYPGTRAATLQRSGRAGRRKAPALTVTVLSSRPLDQFIAAAPGFLFDEPPEHARIDPDNPEIFVPHLRCAAYELPFDDGDDLAGISAPELSAALGYLANRGAIHRETDGEGRTRYLALGDAFPADDVDLRGTVEENFTVIEVAPHTGDDGRILAEVDFEEAPFYLHVGAIYPLEGRTYEVRRLDWDARKAYVKPVVVSYYTEAVSKLRVRMLNQAQSEQATRGGAGSGYAHVVLTVPAFKKLRFRTHENVGFGPVNLPDLELHTVAAWWSVPDSVLDVLADPERRADAALAAAHAIHHVAAMILMCDVGDLGRAVAASHDGAWAVGATRRTTELVMQARGRPCIYLYDKMPGGTGLAGRIAELGAVFLERVIMVASGCRCESGCPTCVGTEIAALPPGGDGAAQVRADALAVLQGLRDQALAGA
jgi:DEAD/DEAH box helicase domain-containing protein